MAVNNHPEEYFSQNKRRRWCARFGIFALTLQLALPLVLGMPAAFFAGGGNSYATPVIVCDLIGVNTGVPKNNGPNPDNQFPSCPICQQFRSISHNFMPPQPVAISTPINTMLAWYRPSDGGSDNGPATSVKHPRAPPFSV